MEEGSMEIKYPQVVALTPEEFDALSDAEKREYFLAAQKICVTVSGAMSQLPGGSDGLCHD